jgi:8-oxo-dGTP pyrophosphatase MutT (NUDIX family)
MSKKYIYAFGGLRYFEALKKESDENKFVLVHIADELEDTQGFAKAPGIIAALFNDAYDTSQEAAAFVNLGRGTVIGGLENIAKAWDLLREQHPNLKEAAFIGPSYEAAKTFFDKKLIWHAFEQEGIATPKTVELATTLDTEEVVNRSMSVPFPAILKATQLSGGRGMKLVNSTDELLSAFDEFKKSGLGDLILTEYVDGIEVSFAVLRLGDTFMRMPACYKEETSLDLRHPDSKVKLAGGFKEFEDAYSAVEKLMAKLDITGWLYLEGILYTDDAGQPAIKFIEGATRLSGNSPIEVGSLEGFNFYRTLVQWIEDRSIGFAYRNRLCIQHASFKHHGEADVEKLLALDWVLEASYEDLAKVPFSTDDRTRIRISFIGETFHTAKERAKVIAEIVDNPGFAVDIKRVLDNYAKSDYLYVPHRLSSGVWNENISWEFYVSSHLPDTDLCTATFCLALQGDDKIVLTKTKRGWEMPGGHMESDETLEEALFREAHEEGGYTPQQYKLFGYRKITSKQPIPARAGREYPYPVSYIPHFIAKSDLPLEGVHGEEDEVLDSRTFALSELRGLAINEIAIIESGLPFRGKL